jgi:hypothetical protein
MYQFRMRDKIMNGAFGGMRIGGEKQKHSQKICKRREQNPGPLDL